MQPDMLLVEEIIAAVEANKTSIDWRKDGGKYIPYPATWLNRKGWMYDPGAPSGITPLPEGPKPGSYANPKGFQTERDENDYPDDEETAE